MYMYIYIYAMCVCVCVCVGKDKNLKIWRESDGEHHKDAPGHKSTVYCLAFDRETGCIVLLFFWCSKYTRYLCGKYTRQVYCLAFD